MSRVLTIQPAAPGGLPEVNPVGRAIAGSAKTRRIYQGFQQQGTNSITSLPVVRHLSGAVCQNLTRQSFHLHPRQDQKPTVIDDPL